MSLVLICHPDDHERLEQVLHQLGLQAEISTPEQHVDREELLRKALIVDSVYEGATEPRKHTKPIAQDVTGFYGRTRRRK